MTTAIKKAVKTLFRVKIRSRHPSHAPFRTKLPLLPFPSVVRLGSTTNVPDLILKSGKKVKRIEINSPEAIRNSSSKFLMKECFKLGNVKTAEFYKVKEVKDNLENWEIFPMVAKINFGSRGRGMHLINSKEELVEFLNKKDLSGYYFERFYNYSREYRIHVTKDGYFYTCRKMLKKDAPENTKYFRNDSNCVWILEANPQFEKPSVWNDIVKESIKALTSVGLDMGAIDLRVQSEKDGKGNKREKVDFIIIEVNSAPSMGDITLEKYLEEIPKVLKKKAQEWGI